MSKLPLASPHSDAEDSEINPEHKLATLTLILEHLDQTPRDLEQIALQLGAIRPWSPSRWPRPTPSAMALSSTIRAAAPSLNAAEIYELWTRKGTEMFTNISSRDTRAARAAIRDPKYGPLLSVWAFLDPATRRMSGQQRTDLFLHAFFARWTCERELMSTLRDERSEASSPLGNEILSELRAFRPKVSLLSLLHLRLLDPSQFQHFPDGCRMCEEWAKGIASARLLERFEDGLVLLEYFSGGLEPRAVSSNSGIRVVLRALGDMGREKPDKRLEIASIIQRFLGNVFDPQAPARWNPLGADLLPMVRGWLAGEVLDILFRNLLPDGAGSHQTLPRREFWKSYTNRVDRVGLVLSSSLQGRAEDKSIRDLKERMQKHLQLIPLRGGPQQALIWMRLVNVRGEVFTVVEGNANTSLRMTPGDHWPRRNTVDYSREVVQNPIWHDGIVISHNYGWQRDAANWLHAHQLFPEPLRAQR